MDNSIESADFRGYKYKEYTTFCYKAILLYILTFSLFLLKYSNFLPSINHICLQFLTLAIFAFICQSCLKTRNDANKFIIVLFFCILFEFFSFRIWNIIVYQNELGYDPRDASGYHDLAVNFTVGNFAFWDVVDYIRAHDSSIDDFGFKTIICLTYKFFGIDIGVHALVFFNAIVWTASCVYLYKLSRLLKVSQEGSKFISILWGCFSYSIYTASVGLKENFFCFFVILSMYRLYKYINNKSSYNLILFLTLSISCLLFRLAVYFIIITTFLFSLAIRFKLIYKHLKVWISLGIMCAIILVPIVIAYIANMRGNMAISQGYADAIASGDNVFIYTAMNVISVFTGPVPNFITDFEKQNYITLWNFGSFLRFLLSGYSLYAIFCIIKKKTLIFYPMIFYIVLHSVMLVITMFSIQDRYQVIQLPFIYILIVYGMNQLQKAKKTTKLFYNRIYIGGANLFIILFNILKFR